MRYHRPRKHRRKFKYLHQSQGQEYAKQRSGGSLGGCPIRGWGLRILHIQSGEKTIGKIMNFAEQDVNAKGIDVYAKEEQKMV